jgi:hypothetical protein
MVDMSGTIKHTITTIVKNIAGVLSASCLSLEYMRYAVKKPMSSRKELSIFENHFDAVAVVVHFCTSLNVIVKIKDIHF